MTIMEALALSDVSMYHFCKCHIHPEFAARTDWALSDPLKMTWSVGTGHSYYILVSFQGLISVEKQELLTASDLRYNADRCGQKQAEEKLILAAI